MRKNFDKIKPQSDIMERYYLIMTQKLKQDISIGKNLRKLRLQMDLTQEQVAPQMQVRGCNVSRETYSMMERGKYSIRISELIALRQIFHADYNDFFENIEF